MAENTASTGHTSLAYILNFSMDSQDPRFTIPLPYISGLYDPNTLFLPSYGPYLTITLNRSKLRNRGTPAIALGLKLASQQSTEDIK
jgi:hypothetical protein